MLIAYIDEVGEPGAFVSYDHAKFKTSPVFGYAGFVIPEERVHDFSRQVTQTKREFFSFLHPTENYIPTWEGKGAELFQKGAMERTKGRREILALRDLLEKLPSAGGSLFYFVREKAIGTPGQVWGSAAGSPETRSHIEERTLQCLAETINRLCTHADYKNQNILLFQDMINESQRKAQVARSYANIYARMKEHQEMRRILEAPAYIDSDLSSNIQCADWIAALIGRACNYQLNPSSPYAWVGDTFREQLRGSFTYESTLQFHARGIENIRHSELLSHSRPFLKASPQLSEDDRRKLQLIHAKASAPIALEIRQTHSEKSTYDQ